MRLCKKIIVACLLMLSIMSGSFAQSFSDSLNWTVKCVNLKSHRERSYSVTPNDLASFHQLFKEKTAGFENEDMVYIKVKINGTDVVLEDTLSYGKAKHFWANHALLLTDCEEYIYASYTKQGSLGASGGTWTGAILNRSFDNIESDIDTDLKSPQGSGSFYIEYGGKAKEEIKKTYPSLTRNHLGKENYFYQKEAPEDVYFFFYLYGTENANASLRLKVREFDTYFSHDAKFDSYFYVIPLNFKGWKQFAIRYSDMQIDKKASNSNLIKEPEKINSISYMLVNESTNEKARLNIDYLMILH
jgi:hypothetical protein